MIDLQGIFKRYGNEYRKKHNLPIKVLKAMRAIEKCRTAEMGGHVDECDECGHLRISYDSCRNRHCPKCQTFAKEKWIEARKKELLPIGYFHVVFTIPQELNYITLANQREMYAILFKAASETLHELGKDKKYLGALLGFISVLHTWGQNLMNHPHIHCIVPSGGLSLDGTRWINSKKKFFIPVKVLSRVFRGKFLFYFKKAYDSNLLKCTSGIEELLSRNVFQALKNKLYEKEWIVFCKAPFKSPGHVLEYLGRYTHRVCISNNRILSAEDGEVKFKWRDYRDKNKEKVMMLSADEFIRRFIMHILPPGFIKIRHFGFLSNKNKSTKLKICKRLTFAMQNKVEDVYKKLTTSEILIKLAGKDINVCPCCKKGKMVIRQTLTPKNYTIP